MQQALVISSHYDASSGYPNLGAWATSAELLSARLAQYGYELERLAPGPGLVRQLREFLRSGSPHASLLVYFCGYGLVTESGDPALLMADESVTALRISQLVSKLGRGFGRALLLLDTTLGSSSRDVELACRSRGLHAAWPSPEQGMGELVMDSARESNVSVVLSVRPWGAQDRRVSAFTRLIDQALKELGNPAEQTTASQLFGWMQPRGAQAGLELRFRAADPDFVVLPQRRYPSNPALLSPSPILTAGISIPPPPPPPPVAFPRVVDETPPPPAPDQFVPRVNVPAQARVPLSVPPAFEEEPARLAEPPPEESTPSSPASPVVEDSVVLRVSEPEPLAEPAMSEERVEVRTELSPTPAPDEVWPYGEPRRPSLQAAPIVRTPGTTPARPSTGAAPRHSSDASVEAAAVSPAAPPAPPARMPEEYAGPPSWQPAARPPVPRAPEDEAGLIARAKHAAAQGEDVEALSLARRCLELFPGAVAALQIAATLLAKLERWEELAGLYEQLIDGHPDPAAVAKLCIAASRLYTSKLDAPSRAARALERACQLQPKNAELHLEAAAFYETQAKEQLAEAHYRMALNVEPSNPRVYRRASAFFTWTRQIDLAWNAASVISFLGKPNSAETQLLEKYPSEGLPQPARALGTPDFASGLTPTPTDPGLAQFFTFIAETARGLRLLKPRQQQALLARYVEDNPLTSTTTLARTFNWCCRLFSVSTPSLYLDEGSAVPSALPVDRGAWLVGKSLGRGLELRELVFIWSRALAHARPESRVSLSFPEPPGLLELGYAALWAAGLAAQVPEQALKLGKALKKRLEPNMQNALAERLDGIDAATLPARIAAWQRQQDFVANRLGLVACGDPAIAARTLDRFPSGGTPPAEQLADLLNFATSQSYATLRRELGLAHG